MPAPTTATEFLDLVRRSTVVDEKKLGQYLEQCQGDRALPLEPARLADVLVHDGVLTQFQAEQFLQGKWRRFSIGKYRILERLGSGGMGNVFLCEHTLMRRRVAVKVLPVARAADPASLERFYREARCVAALDHPNLVHAYDIGEDDKLHFLVLEYVDGANLQEIVRATGPLSPLRTAHYIAQAALGLHHAFECASLVHRDVKPSNILVDRQGIVKLLDLGLARFFNDEEDVLTKKYDENVLGTADYLAPEQALDSHAVDIRADIYSLGATAYFCLTGRPPFSEGSVAQKLVWHQTRQPKPIATIRDDAPAELIAIIDKMMAKEPDGRYSTPREVVDALAAWTKEPIDPPSEAEMPRLSRAASREWRSTDPGSSSHGAVPRLPKSPPAAAPEKDATPVHKLAQKTPPPSLTSASQSASIDELVPWQVTQQAGQAIAEAGRAAVLTHSQATRSATFAVAHTAPAAMATPAAFTDLPLWRRMLVVMGFVAVAVTIFFIGLMFFSGCAPSPGWSVKNSSSSDSSAVSGPILKVGGNDASAYPTLKKAILAAKSGAHIRVEGALQELLEVVNKDWDPPVVVEPAGDDPVTWTPGKGAPTGDPLVDLQEVHGLEFHNFILDGQDRQEVGVQLLSVCPGVVFEKVQFRGFTKRELQTRSTAGYEGRPVKLIDLSVVITEPRATGAFQFSFRKEYNQSLRTQHLVVHGCRFEGPFKTSPVESDGNFADIDWDDNVWLSPSGQKEVPEPK